MEKLVFFVPFVGVLALAFAFYKNKMISRVSRGNERMIEISSAIQEGAMAFIKKEYRALSFFVAIVAFLLAFSHMGSRKIFMLQSVSFVVGAACSGLSGFFGLRIATNANVRTANAARESLSRALEVAFGGGVAIGMSVVGLGIVGLSVLFIVYSSETILVATSMEDVLMILSGFSMGASSIALFARVGGGIYTKAADIGADLVGKVETGIPEDDPRNPAVIADNVGDNVGDVAGMGADLFESYVGAILASMIIGATISGTVDDFVFIALPLVLAAIGILASILGTFFVKTSENGNPQNALNLGTYFAGFSMLVISAFFIYFFVPEYFLVPGKSTICSKFGLFFSISAGLVSGIGIGFVTEHYCAKNKTPVNEIVEACATGSATTIIGGISVGMRSTAYPIILIVFGIIVSNYFAGLYGIALAALGMLSTTGMQLAVDAYGPIADNAGGIAEMSALDPEVRRRTDSLDAVGNTTAAIGKGFAIGSAALTAFALFSAYQTQLAIFSGKSPADIVMNISSPHVMSGLFVGAMLPFLFSSMALKAVGKAAFDMIREVRRQFKEIPGLIEGNAKPEYAKCVEISTSAAIREMVAPGLLAVLVPILAGFLDSTGLFLGGILAGATSSGVLLAIFMSNSGGAWDNAKKQIEDEKIDEKLGKGKFSFRHSAAVVGDTVGDPFKDTAGPSINILIKLMSVVSLVMAPFIVKYGLNLFNS